MANRIYDYDNMSPEEMREYLKRISKRNSENSIRWHKNNREKSREYQKKYRGSLTYAINQLKYWQRKVEELSNQKETEDNE